MEVLVLGPGCARCKQVYQEAEKAVAGVETPIELRKVEKLSEIMTFGVMSTPAVIVDGEVKCTGSTPDAEQIAVWINERVGKGSTP